MARPSTLERAYKLAESGHFETVAAVQAKLVEEGYAGVEAALRSRQIQGHLRAICSAARARAALIAA